MATKSKGKETVGVGAANSAIGRHIAKGINAIVSDGGSRGFQKARARIVGRQLVSLVKKNLAAQKRGGNNNSDGG
jgi:hypothetical protein